MKTLLLLLPLYLSPACVVAPEAPQNPQNVQAVDAFFTRGGAADFHDADPVQARAASFGKVVPVVDAFPWNDRLVELLPIAVEAPPQPAAPSAPNLSADVVDADPLASRGWR